MLAAELQPYDPKPFIWCMALMVMVIFAIQVYRLSGAFN